VAQDGALLLRGQAKKASLAFVVPRAEKSRGILFASACALITQLGSRPPAKEDALMFLYDGLNKETKNSARADPRTGQAWTDFDALAITLHLVRSRGTWFKSSGPQKRCFCARFTLRHIISKWTPSKIESLHHV
jgi:hypothetical protein